MNIVSIQTQQNNFPLVQKPLKEMIVFIVNHKGYQKAVTLQGYEFEEVINVLKVAIERAEQNPLAEKSTFS